MRNLTLSAIILALFSLLIVAGLSGCGDGSTSTPSSLAISVERWDGASWWPVSSLEDVYESDELSFDVLAPTMHTASSPQPTHANGGVDIQWDVHVDGKEIEMTGKDWKLPAGDCWIVARFAAMGGQRVTRHLTVLAGNRPVTLDVSAYTMQDPALDCQNVEIHVESNAVRHNVKIGATIAADGTMSYWASSDEGRSETKTLYVLKDGVVLPGSLGIGETRATTWYDPTKLSTGIMVGDIGRNNPAKFLSFRVYVPIPDGIG